MKERWYEPVKDYVLIGPSGQMMNVLALTESEARDSNLELKSEGARARWEPYQQAA